MLKKIVLNNQEFHFSESNLPTLIHGEDHAGASLFTVSMVADLFTQGSRLLVLTGYPMARAEFLDQTDKTKDFVLATGNEKPEILQEKQAIFLLKENADFFVRLTQELRDIHDRVILIKNIELFEEDILKAIKESGNLIISGDIDECLFKSEIRAKDFTTKIFFSPLKVDTTIKLPQLQKYEGYLVSPDNRGNVSLKIEN